jgi:hypothetical protein
VAKLIHQTPARLLQDEQDRRHAVPAAKLIHQTLAPMMLNYKQMLYLLRSDFVFAVA